jgi:hypothetical protein
MINETIYISINIKNLHRRIIYGNLTILVYKPFCFQIKSPFLHFSISKHFKKQLSHYFADATIIELH